jgi:hypothetical protein
VAELLDHPEPAHQRVILRPLGRVRPLNWGFRSFGYRGCQYALQHFIASESLKVGLSDACWSVSVSLAPLHFHEHLIRRVSGISCFFRPLAIHDALHECRVFGRGRIWHKSNENDLPILRGLGRAHSRVRRGSGIIGGASV